MTEPGRRYDVAILGGGLAGLSLARHLLLDTDKSVVLLERGEAVPADRQKVGESLVQLSGFYFSRILDLEEHLFREHYIKYNLRFYWKTPGRANDTFEDYSQAYVQKLSNIASYQLDRNALEVELVARNRAAGDRFTLLEGARDLAVELAEDDAPHRVTATVAGEPVEIAARWVVDASGRNRFLAKRLGLLRPSPICHGASWAWVEGLVDIERLSRLSRREQVRNPDRARTGHLPFWLATNHFCGDGFWFWVIPLQGKTSLGVVFDRETFPRERVATPEKLIEWACEEFPLFARDLPQRRLLEGSGYRECAHDCARTISAQRWAMTGEAGRFTDALYSPGGDLIALHNTMIVDAIETADPAELEAKARQWETLLRSLYEAYVPSYAVSYGVLGDREGFVLKYTWELAIYFCFYVFPFVNGLFTDRRFALAFLNRFGRLGPVNQGVQALLAAYAEWKRRTGRGEAAGEAVTAFDFFDVAPLEISEKAFYDVGLDVAAAKERLNVHLARLEEMGRWITVHAAAGVLGEPRALTDAAFVAALDPAATVFDPEAFRRLWNEVGGTAGEHRWSFDPAVLERAGLTPAEGPAAAPAPTGAAPGEEPRKAAAVAMASGAG
ncbi:MAG TPA: hypothetical protein VHQ65_06660 [Thermoanaerobaculia bacterium]|nr:hypothetical protein [Thermoanaerobaculia bacterium]